MPEKKMTKKKIYDDYDDDDTDVFCCVIAFGGSLCIQRATTQHVIIFPSGDYFHADAEVDVMKMM